MADLNESLRNSLAGPASASVDGQTVSEHPLSSQIEATKFQMATRARSLGPLAGATLTKIRPHGAVLPAGDDVTDYPCGGGL